MTPAARLAAAITVLDDVIAGTPAERALTQWARTHRFAGSGDRAALRDHVYDVLRARRSLAALGGGMTGRALILGLLRRDGPDPDSVFGSGGHAPDALTADERTVEQQSVTGAAAADLPDWLWPLWQEALGEEAMSAAQLQRQRAPVFLRVNLSRGTRYAAQASLLADAVPTAPHPLVDTALRVLDNPRRVAASAAYREGLVEVQDSSSQVAIARLPLLPGQRILDFCAGGGGKALALADRLGGPVWAHDIDPRRMTDIAPRAARAEVQITPLATAALSKAAPFDLILCDAPCSGSGTWRRTPDAKWRLTPERLTELNAIQSEILDRAALLTQAGSVMAYATCSVLTAENDGIVAPFLERHPDWTRIDRMALQPTEQHDGFQMSVMRRT
ncbi:MAG: RsmB/NOP family class I SAM-dependent RNA methyltransferase [Alphaproteobacteria bacterium]|nr:RsmB/NOP family class I SAM-dependent RNA methyltransferase [Alphaproteobacteria bacterium]